MVSFINDSSRFCYIYLLLKKKYKVLDKFKNSKPKIELQQRLLKDVYELIEVDIRLWGSGIQFDHIQCHVSRKTPPPSYAILGAF